MTFMLLVLMVSDGNAHGGHNGSDHDDGLQAWTLASLYKVGEI